MPYAALADLVVVAHLGFVAFVALGALPARRRAWVLALHVPAVAWALGIVTIGWPCPLTGLEQALRRRAGTAGYTGGFVDEYLTGVLYPKRFERAAQALVALTVLACYAAVLRPRRARRPRVTPLRGD